MHTRRSSTSSALPTEWIVGACFTPAHGVVGVATGTNASTTIITMTANAIIGQAPLRHPARTASSPRTDTMTTRWRRWWYRQRCHPYVRESTWITHTATVHIAAAVGAPQAVRGCVTQGRGRRATTPTIIPSTAAAGRWAAPVSLPLLTHIDAMPTTLTSHGTSRGALAMPSPPAALPRGCRHVTHVSGLWRGSVVPERSHHRDQHGGHEGSAPFRGGRTKLNAEHVGMRMVIMGVGR